jgi:hypothetical protein
MAQGASWFFMDRTYEELRSEVLELGRDEQEKLRDEIDRNLVDRTAYAEAKRRADAVDRGEMQTVDGPEALARVRNLITH